MTTHLDAQGGDQVMITKLAAIREQGYPQGVSAPCWFHCPCGEKVPAFQGDQRCQCGQRYDARGWLLDV